MSVNIKDVKFDAEVVEFKGKSYIQTEDDNGNIVLTNDLEFLYANADIDTGINGEHEVTLTLETDGGLELEVTLGFNVKDLLKALVEKNKPAPAINPVAPKPVVGVTSNYDSRPATREVKTGVTISALRSTELANQIRSLKQKNGKTIKFKAKIYENGQLAVTNQPDKAQKVVDAIKYAANSDIRGVDHDVTVIATPNRDFTVDFAITLNKGIVNRTTRSQDIANNFVSRIGQRLEQTGLRNVELVVQ